MKTPLSRLSLLNRLLLLTTFSFVIGMSLLAGVIYERISASYESQLRERMSGELDKFNSQVDKVAQTSLEKASLFSRDADVIAAYRLALPGMAEPTADSPAYASAREQLKASLGDTVAGFKLGGQGRFGLHFHTPEGRSLWRAWKSDQALSDDISGFRPSVLQANREPFAPVQGIEVGVGGFAIRGIVPILSEEGQHLGSVEYLGSFQAVFESLSSGHGEAAAVYMNAEYLPIALELQDSTRNPRIGDFIQVSLTDKAVFEKTVNPDWLIQMQQETVFMRGDHYLFAGAPIHDFSGQAAGILLLAYPTEGLRSLQRGLLVLIAGLSIAVMAGICVLLLLILRPLQSVRVYSDEIETHAEAVRQSVGEISGAAASLAGASSQQAASLQQTRAALEMTSRLAEDNQQKLKEALALSSQNRQGLNESETKIEALGNAMDGILESSREISNIIKTIDEIAFQTNILALNPSFSW